MPLYSFSVSKHSPLFYSLKAVLNGITYGITYIIHNISDFTNCICLLSARLYSYVRISLNSVFYLFCQMFGFSFRFFLSAVLCLSAPLVFHLSAVTSFFSSVKPAGRRVLFFTRQKNAFKYKTKITHNAFLCLEIGVCLSRKSAY